MGGCERSTVSEAGEVETEGAGTGVVGVDGVMSISGFAGGDAVAGASVSFSTKLRVST